jgi:hypothetical protein
VTSSEVRNIRGIARRVPAASRALAALLAFAAPRGVVAGEGKANLPPIPSSSKPLDAPVPPAGLRQLIETDWVVQAMMRAGQGAQAPKGKRGGPASPGWQQLAPEADKFQGPFPTAQVIARARALAEELRRLGADVGPHVKALDEAEGRLKSLAPNAPGAAQREAYFAARRAARKLAFANPLLRFDKLLFVKRFTQEPYPDVCLNHMPWVSKPGGDLCVLAAPAGRSLADVLADPSDGKPAPTLRNILNRALGPGHVHGMDLWFDADRIVFGYSRTRTDDPPQGWLNRSTSYTLRRTEEPTHIFEVSVDGSRLRQLTSGEWSDLDPTYVPSGDIVFVSERCGTSLQCNEYDKDETSCNLYVMKPDGTGIRWMNVNKDGDYLPHCLDNGLVGYTRWEYHERGWAFIQSIWFIRPDGTGADAIFKQHMPNPWALYDVRSIPGGSKMVAVAGGHHTLYIGPVVVIDPTVGLNEARGIGIVTPDVKPQEGGMAGVPVPEGGVADGGGIYATPWPLSDKFFLASYSCATLPMSRTDPPGYALYLIDVFGTKELIYRDPAISSFIPLPLRPRPKPPVIPDSTDQTKDYAVCTINDVGFGSPDIAPRIRYVRVAEPIGWPYDNAHGGQRYSEKGGNMINWTPVRILGDVPVEADGSAHFMVPPHKAVYFQLLDENRVEIRRMRSFITMQRGEQRGCVGCHETRAEAPIARVPGIASSRPPVRPIPPPWGDRPISFPRDVQPIFDRHCVGCHTGLKPAGGLDFCGGLTTYSPRIAGYGHNRAYDTLIGKRLVSFSAVHAQDASITPPLAYGAHKSKLVEVLRRAPHTERAKLTAEEWLRLTMWIDANTPYHDTFVNKRPARPVYDLAGDSKLQQDIAAVHQRRCASCHKPNEVSRLDWINIHEPARSLFLAAPLSKPAGGTGKCGEVYKTASDPDYQAVLKLCRDAVTKVWADPRRDVQALKAPRQ